MMRGKDLLWPTGSRMYWVGEDGAGVGIRPERVDGGCHYGTALRRPIQVIRQRIRRWNGSPFRICHMHDAISVCVSGENRTVCWQPAGRMIGVNTVLSIGSMYWRMRG